jgi:hypothetical protein
VDPWPLWVLGEKVKVEPGFREMGSHTFLRIDVLYWGSGYTQNVCAYVYLQRLGLVEWTALYAGGRLRSSRSASIHGHPESVCLLLLGGVTPPWPLLLFLHGAGERGGPSQSASPHLPAEFRLPANH